ncbi:MAG: DUF6036 family nucleotidyltransferase [Candidatus Moranbacteria bacterium]|nr:DUF6036 family nucleotidyltransferase [Candidatus Moranbacteria bacterium]
MRRIRSAAFAKRKNVQFYNDLTTQKSFVYLQKLNKQYKFILIGGWAVYLYSKSLKSKDIDIIVDYDVLAKIKETGEVFKNERLRKYEINAGNFDVDIYVPHYSELGIDTKSIENSAVNQGGFSVPALEILLLMKLFAWRNRRGSSKGQKDELDIFSLALLPEFNWKKYQEYVKKFQFSEYDKEFVNLLKSTHSIKELDVNEQKMAKFRKRILAEVV